MQGQKVEEGESSGLEVEEPSEDDEENEGDESDGVVDEVSGTVR